MLPNVSPTVTIVAAEGLVVPGIELPNVKAGDGAVASMHSHLRDLCVKVPNMASRSCLTHYPRKNPLASATGGLESLMS